ncbi:MAG: hypothetical protein WDW38_002275 [Sanguina aurantia]
MMTVHWYYHPSETFMGHVAWAMAQQSVNVGSVREVHARVGTRPAAQHLFRVFAGPPGAQQQQQQRLHTSAAPHRAGPSQVPAAHRPGQSPSRLPNHPPPNSPPLRSPVQASPLAHTRPLGQDTPHQQEPTSGSSKRCDPSQQPQQQQPHEKPSRQERPSQQQECRPLQQQQQQQQLQQLQQQQQQQQHLLPAAAQGGVRRLFEDCTPHDSPCAHDPAHTSGAALYSAPGPGLEPSLGFVAVPLHASQPNFQAAGPSHGPSRHSQLAARAAPKHTADAERSGQPRPLQAPPPELPGSSTHQRQAGAAEVQGQAAWVAGGCAPHAHASQGGQDGGAGTSGEDPASQAVLGNLRGTLGGGGAVGSAKPPALGEHVTAAAGGVAPADLTGLIGQAAEPGLEAVESEVDESEMEVDPLEEGGGLGWWGGD